MTLKKSNGNSPIATFYISVDIEQLIKGWNNNFNASILMDEISTINKFGEDFL